LALRGLAALKWLRPLGSRFQQEQADIEQWRQAVLRGLQQDPALGLALARCGQLIKGYGRTNERAKRHLQHILQASSLWDATAVDQARQAALQDEAGAALNQQLNALGAPLLPVAVQPLRFVRNATRVDKA
jgi:indolepyruvate ferredoxin oxidoreductase beta subunit